MQAVFADTFYWIALTNIDDLIHQQALSLSQTLGPACLITTEEVRGRYLAYSSGARRSVREHAAECVKRFV